jgi:hypothetical protein
MSSQFEAGPSTPIYNRQFLGNEAIPASKANDSHQNPHDKDNLPTDILFREHIRQEHLRKVIIQLGIIEFGSKSSTKRI